MKYFPQIKRKIIHYTLKAIIWKNVVFCGGDL